MLTPQDFIHSNGNLCQHSRNRHESLRTKVEVEDVAGAVKAPHVAAAGYYLREKAGRLEEFLCEETVSEKIVVRIHAPHLVRVTAVLVADADGDLGKESRVSA